MNRHPACAAILAVAAVLSGCAAPGGSSATGSHTVTVAAGAFARAGTPVSFPLPESVAGPHHLVDASGASVPLQLDSDGNVTRVRLEGGPPFCIAEFTYPPEKLKLRPGETLVLVSDGVTEAQNASGALFGRDRILSGRGEWARSATAICDAIRDQVRTFEEGTDATDDLTVLAIRYCGSA